VGEGEKQLLPRVQTRFVVTFGFLVLGCSMLYSRTLRPDIDFRRAPISAPSTSSSTRTTTA
jgi:hypothetical protein